MAHNKLRFPATNESLASIIAGMDVQEDDEILAICGSGDQAFALAEYAQRVMAVDFNSAQVKYAQKRKEELLSNDMKDFLECDTRLVADPGYYSCRDAYFREKGRMVKIRQKLGSLDFQKVDFFDVLARERNLTKLYLSNILTRPYLNTRKVRETIAGLPEGVLLYLVCHEYKNLPLYEMPLKIEEKLTQRAKAFANQAAVLWEPLVCRKVK